jgi:SAM-dependent methyltransferase
VATTAPWPSDGELATAYAGPYRPAGGRFAGPGDALLRRSRAALARRLDRMAPPGPVLDVGAGEGALVAALARRGREAVGLERESAPVEVPAPPGAAVERGVDVGRPLRKPSRGIPPPSPPHIRAGEVTRVGGPAGGPHIRAGEVTRVGGPAGGPHIRAGEVTRVGGRWAAVVFWHSLEHLREPGRALDHAAGLLAPGGVLVVAAPNAASLQARLFGERWFALDLPRHLVHVPAPALLARLRARGLRVERVSHLRGGQVLFGWLHGLVGALPGHPDLYDAIRRPAARRRPLSPAARGATLAAACLLAPAAVAGAAVEVAARRGGSVYVEARRG